MGESVPLPVQQINAALQEINLLVAAAVFGLVLSAIFAHVSLHRIDRICDDVRAKRRVPNGQTTLEAMSHLSDALGWVVAMLVCVVVAFFLVNSGL